MKTNITIGRPLLEIVMPTFNRLSALQKNLPNILDQAAGCGALITFYDNASSDGTQEYLSKLAASSPQIRYMRNEVNIGLDRNMLLGVKQSVGKYLFWLGDDDVLRPDALEVIESIIKDYKPHLLLLQMMFPPDEWCDVSKPQIYYQSPDKFFNECCYLMPFGTQIFDAEMAKKQLVHADRFLGTYHAYTGLLLDSLAEAYQKEGKITIVRHVETLVKCTAIPKAWAADKAEMYISGLPKWFELLHPIYAELAKTKKNEFTLWADYLDLLQKVTIDKCDPGALLSSLQDALISFRLQVAEKNRQLEEEKKIAKISERRAVALEKRLQSLINTWTKIGWLLFPWTKPGWCKNTLNTLES